jgi:hypothetical protein
MAYPILPPWKTMDDEPPSIYRLIIVALIADGCDDPHYAHCRVTTVREVRLGHLSGYRVFAWTPLPTPPSPLDLTEPAF